MPAWLSSDPAEVMAALVGVTLAGWLLGTIAAWIAAAVRR